MDQQLEKALRISAALARQRYAGEDKRIDKGLVIALNDKVSIKDGICRVQSDRDLEVFYVVSAHGCDCIDSTSSAPDHRCKHVWAGKLLAHAFSSLDKERDFWTRVDKRGDDECWEWQGSRVKSKWNYGATSWNGKHIKAHRLAWLLTHGDIAEDMHVCHACDNPPCCNPAHLWLGTRVDNVQDSIKKGRFEKNQIKVGPYGLRYLIRDAKPLTPELKHMFPTFDEQNAISVDCESQVLENPDDKYTMSNDAQESTQKESTMSDVILFTTAPKSFDKATTVEVCDTFLYAMSCTSTTVNMATHEYTRQDTMRKVSVPSKKALTQERAYNKPAIFFTCNEEKAAELREKGIITMKKAEQVETPAPAKRKRTRKVTTTSTREDGTLVHVTAPENEPVGEGAPTDTAAALIEEIAAPVDPLVALDGQPYNGPLPGTFTVVAVEKGPCPIPAPEGSNQTAHLSCNKTAQEPEVIPVVPAVLRLRGVLQHAMSYEVYENMVEAITKGLEDMGVKLGATAPAPAAPRAPRAPQEPRAPRTEGARVGGLSDAQVTHARTTFAKGGITVGALAKDIGVPKSTLRRCLRLGGLIKQRD